MYLVVFAKETDKYEALDKANHHECSSLDEAISWAKPQMEKVHPSMGRAVVMIVTDTTWEQFKQENP